MDTLRALLIQRAARLQERPALACPGWGPLSYAGFRNRVEGVALGLMAQAPPLGAGFHSSQGGPWDWVCEVAAACCGLQWDPAGPRIDPAILGGASFNHEEGRQPYHDRDHDLTPATPFQGALDHGTLLSRLRRLNGRLGWDHATEVTVPMDQLASQAVRAALWSALFGGSSAILKAGRVKDWDPEPFRQIFL